MKYQVIAPVLFSAGSVVGMNEEQAEARAHFIKPHEKKGFYEVTGTIQFKTGEFFIYLGDLPKALVSAVDDGKKPKKGQQAFVDNKESE